MKKKQSLKSRMLPLFDLSLSKRTKRRVSDVLESGWLSTGAVCAELECEIEKKFGVPYVTAVSSATAGLIASLKAAGIGNGDEVILPSFTFIATAEAVKSVGATVRFADIDTETWSVDPFDVARKINKRTKAIIPVDYAGIPADYTSLRKLARKHHLNIISDSSHALGATYKNKPISAYCDYSVVSLHVTKNLSSAEGGLVISHSRENIEHVRLLTRHGITRNAWQRRSKGSVEYDVVADGLKGNLSDVLAAIALGELPHFSANQKKRARLAKKYTQLLSHYADSIQLIEIPLQIEATWHLIPIRLRMVKRRTQRDAVVAAMKKKGIECGIHYKPLHTMSLFRGHKDAKSLPVTNEIGKSVMVLPLYPLMSARDVDRVAWELIESLLSLKLLAGNDR